MQIDWNEAPAGAQWWAVDANGQAYWFFAPEVEGSSLVWRTKTTHAPNFGYEGEWRHSLTPRPSGQQGRGNGE